MDALTFCGGAGSSRSAGCVPAVRGSRISLYRTGTAAMYAVARLRAQQRGYAPP
jgi:hypothetical protein